MGSVESPPEAHVNLNDSPVVPKSCTTFPLASRAVTLTLNPAPAVTLVAPVACSNTKLAGVTPLRILRAKGAVKDPLRRYPKFPLE